MKNDIIKAVAAKIARLRTQGKRVIVAIDGRCAAGKTTFAEELKLATGCTVFHTDDYFLRPEQRVDERLSTPGGNFDRERFLKEVLRPLSSGEDSVVFRKFDCKTMTLGEPVTVVPADVVVVEGAYSCHPDLFGFYDLRVFLSVSKDEQISRISARNGADGLQKFLEKWIPMEEAYFSAFDVEHRCDIAFKT
ncbi:MAG: hypothetical protein J5894_04075 [Clostridia bacterium]|nr:hypothetical protein [Clostridia bacterium]